MIRTSEEEPSQKLGRGNALRLGRVVESGSSIRPPSLRGLLNSQLVTDVETESLGDTLLVLHHGEPTRSRVSRERRGTSVSTVVSAGNGDRL